MEPTNSKKKLLMAIVATATVVVLATVAYYAYTVLTKHEEPPAKTSETISAVDRLPCDRLTTEEATERLKKNTGFTHDALRAAEIKREMFKDFDEALATGKCLQAMEDYKTSYAVLTVANEMATAEQRDESFYEAYINAADYSNNFKTGTKLFKQWRTEVKDSKTMKEEDKAALLEMLDMKIFERENYS